MLLLRFVVAAEAYAQPDMHPAFSVILLTTLIGAGQGLFLALFTVQSHSLVGLLEPVDGRGFYAGGSALALALTGGGLVASFFHLGRPERAWRSAAQWRTSWLSREVIVLPAFMGALALWGVLHATGRAPVLATPAQGTPIELSLVVGIAATLLAFALFVCTGMIYACLRFLAEWHTPLTPLNYTLMGGASGFTLAAGWAALASPPHARFLAGWAIGIKHPNIVQRSQGFMGDSFNTREFFHGRGAPLLRSVKSGFMLTAFALPAAMLAFGPSRSDWLLAAFAVQYSGLLAERWFFFAQANHPQNLYYQAVS